jgi:hypothetical protein
MTSPKAAMAFSSAAKSISQPMKVAPSSRNRLVVGEVEYA